MDGRAEVALHIADVRALMPARSATSSWVIPAAARSFLSATRSVSSVTVTQLGELW